MYMHELAIQPGTTFEGRYEILSLLGKGSFGLVYKARQMSTGQLVAVKLMRLGEHSDEARVAKRIARFSREMQLCAQLQHPHIVQLIDSGQTQEGVLFSVFAYAPGKNLREILAEEGALSPAETQHLMLQVLDALACAHAQGVVHRDLKPSNIMVLSSGARRNAVVLDFGISALLSTTPEKELPRLTGTDEVLGTPGYAAPEQLRGLATSPRSDLFSWGVTFLECLTGLPVYTGSATPEILYAQLSPEPVPLPTLLDGHPLGDLLRRATHKDVNLRTSTAREILTELESYDLRALKEGAGASFLVPVRGRGTPPGASEQAAEQGSAVIEGERRQVTALCFSLETTSGPEEGDELLHQNLSHAAEVVRGYGGYIAAVLGEQVLAYFGYPRAREDDARRAARAALALSETLPESGVGARLGIHTGLISVRTFGGIADAGALLGKTPALAARIAREAALGSILVTGDAQRLLRLSFLLEAAGWGGGDAAVPLYRLLREHRRQESSLTPEGQRSPLVGRRRELDLLLERWERVQNGAGQCSLLTGEPGIGKSRLGREVRDRLAGESYTFLEARCAPDAQNSVLYPILDLLERVMGFEPKTPPARRIEALEAHLSRYGVNTREAMPIFLPLLSLPVSAPYAPLEVSPQQQKELTLGALLSLFCAMAEERPLLLLVEDLHWADATTLEFVGQLVREAPSYPMYVLLTSRPELTLPFSTLGMLQLHLSRLERHQIEEMAAGLAGKKALPPAVLEQVVSRTDGVPLFVEELFRAMLESGALVEHEDGYALTAPLSDAAIPGTLRDLLTARLDRLGRARETAQWASALGREFSGEVLSAVSPLGAEAVKEDLHALIDAGLVYRKRRMGESALLFKHALIRDAAYDALDRDSKRKVHARIARTLEEKFPEIVEQRPDIMAHHLHAAGDSRACQYAVRASQRALSRSANTEALASATEALEWLGMIEAEDERAMIELDLNGVIQPALMALEGYSSERLARVIKRSQELLFTHEKELKDHAQVFSTLWALSAYHSVCFHRDEMLDLLHRGLSLAKEANNVGHQVATLSVLGQMLLFLGDSPGASAQKDRSLEKAESYLNKCLELYDKEAHRALATIYGLDPYATVHVSLGHIKAFKGFLDQALFHVQCAVSWSEEIGHANSIAGSYLHMLIIYQYRREPGQIKRVADDMLRFTTKHNLHFYSGFAVIVRNWATRELEKSREILEMAEKAGTRMGMPYYKALVAETEAAMGDEESAIQSIDKSIKQSYESNQFYYLAESYRLRGEFLKNRDPEASRSDFQKAIQIAQDQGAMLLVLRAACSLYRLTRSPEARAQLNMLYSNFKEGLDCPDLINARQLIA